jgi:hypothetical protein
MQVHRELALKALRAWCPVPIRADTAVRSLSQHGSRAAASSSSRWAELSVASFAALVPAQ